MNNKSYHHGDLKNALIEAGIKIVHKEGIQQLSLRKVAAICGVSHAAPYKHFKDKASLLEAMQLHITEQFSKLLNDIVEEYQNDTDIMHHLGHAYLRFFIENPHYYHFIFGQIGIHINLENEDKENYPPYNIFRNISITVLEKQQIPKEKFTQNITAMWAVIHGITAMAAMDTTSYSGDWNVLLDKIMRENFVFSG